MNAPSRALSRASFIRQLSAGGVMLLAAPSFLASCGNNDDDLPSDIYAERLGRVCVIGAGLAGLQATEELHNLGVSVDLLEAGARVGGRIRSNFDFAPFPVELGAEEIHGSRSDWFQRLTALGADVAETPGEDYFWLEGRLRNEAEMEELPGAEAALQFLEAMESYAGPDVTVEQAAAAAGVDRSGMLLLEAWLGNEHGTSADRLGINGAAEGWRLWASGDDNLGLQSGAYETFLPQMFPFAYGAARLETPVAAIYWEQARPRVETVSGEVLEYDRLVVAAPLKILQEGRIRFAPDLPQSKTEAMSRLGMDAGLKILMNFREGFWPDDMGSLYGAGPAPEIWFTGAGKTVSANVLTAFVNGRLAEELSALPEASAVEACTVALDEIFGGRLASDLMTGSLVMDWSKTAFVGGAYSYPKPGGSRADRLALKENMGDRVFFAGEHTHEGGHFATAHGALETGQSVVEELKDLARRL